MHKAIKQATKVMAMVILAIFVVIIAVSFLAMGGCANTGKKTVETAGACSLETFGVISVTRMLCTDEAGSEIEIKTESLQSGVTE